MRLAADLADGRRLMERIEPGILCTVKLSVLLEKKPTPHSRGQPRLVGLTRFLLHDGRFRIVVDKDEAGSCLKGFRERERHKGLLLKGGAWDG